MAATSLHAPSQRWLTSVSGSRPGDVVELSFGSYAYDTAPGGFGFMGSEFTRYTLAEPVAQDERGEALYDLNECNPCCPIDGSPQLHNGKRHQFQGSRCRPDGESCYDFSRRTGLRR
jgi:hypothetical protein